MLATIHCVKNPRIQIPIVALDLFPQKYLKKKLLLVENPFFFIWISYFFNVKGVYIQ